MLKLSFPKNFLWGTATSAYQVEGNNINNDWYLFEQKDGNILNNQKCSLSSNHYELFKEDILYIKQLNNNAYRFSIEWSRIAPEENKFNKKELEHYKEFINLLKENNITPVVTLHHFTNPIWIYNQGGWENSKTIDKFLEFSEYVVNELKDFVKIWITINEPYVYIYHGYLTGKFPPGYKSDIERVIKVTTNMLQCHVKLYELIHSLDKDSQVGIANHFAIFDPKVIYNPLDHLLKIYYTEMINYSFLNCLIKGKYTFILPDKKFPFFRLKKVTLDKKNTLDFIGVNYYTRYFLSIFKPNKFSFKTNGLKNDLGWEIYPKGLYRILKKLKSYKLPIYITENGVADKNDIYTENFITEHLKYVLKAINKGVDVRGYFYWSLLDNFEWDQGFQHFGLLKIDFNDCKKERKISKGYKKYSEIAKNNGLI